MTAQEELKTVLREVVSPAAREHGYIGSGTSWRRSNALGDCSVVRVQSSDTSSSGIVRCTINIGLVPKPWLDWEQTRYVKPLNPKTVSESMGVWHDRLTTSLVYEDQYRSYFDWWHVWDRRSAMVAAEDMVEQLRVVGFPTLDRLLDREQLKLELRQVDSGEFAQSVADLHLAVVLADEGAGDDLGEVIRRIRATDQGPRSEMVSKLLEWVESRSASASP
jgi:hypothetical protein